MPKGGGLGHGIQTGVATDASVVTKSDSVDLPDGACRALWIQTGGILKVTMIGGTTLEIPGIPDGFLWLGSATRVWATGTGAIVAGVIAYY